MRNYGDGPKSEVKALMMVFDGNPENKSQLPPGESYPSLPIETIFPDFNFRQMKDGKVNNNIVEFGRLAKVIGEPNALDKMFAGAVQSLIEKYGGVDKVPEEYHILGLDYGKRACHQLLHQERVRNRRQS